MRAYPQGQCQTQIASLLDDKLGKIRKAAQQADPIETSSIAPVKAAPKEALAGFRRSTNRDYYGGDFSAFDATSVGDCESACNKSNQCLAYSFDTWNRRCYLKSMIGEYRLDPACISGIRDHLPKVKTVDRPATMFRLRNKVFPYTPRTAQSTNDYDSCLSLCSDDLRCVAFSYVKSSSECQIFSNVGEYFTDGAMDSGFKRQLDEVSSYE